MEPLRKEPTDQSPLDREPKPPFPPQKQDKPGIEAKLTPRPRYFGEAYRPANKLEGKVALITGGDSGIGRAVAVIYAREGADVAITYLPAEERDAQETKRVIEGVGRRCLLLAGDLTEGAFCDQVVQRTLETFGQLDIFVNNAAYQNRKEKPEDITDEEWERTFSTNIEAYFRIVRAAVPHMKPGSSIIATSSVTAMEGSEKLLDYSATKGALDAFTLSLSRNLLSRGIRVNAVSPGPVWTLLNPADQGMKPEQVAKFGQDVPLQRPAQPEEIAPSYVFLASNADSSYITGVILPQTGGDTGRP